MSVCDETIMKIRHTIIAPFMTKIRCPYCLHTYLCQPESVA